MVAKINHTKSTFNRLKYETTGILLLACSVFVFISLFTQSGMIGDMIPKVLSRITGENGGLLVSCLLAYFGFNLCWNPKPLTFNPHTIGITLIFFILLTVFHLNLIPSQHLTRNELISLLWKTGLNGEGGGLLGAFFSISTIYLFARTGTFILLISLGVIAILLFTGIPSNKVLIYLGYTILKIINTIKVKLVNFLYIEEKNKQPKKNKEKTDIKKNAVLTNNLPLIIDYHTELEFKEQKEQEDVTEEKEEPPIQVHPEQNDQHDVDILQTNYALPPLTLLTRPLKVKSNRLNKEILENVRILEETLENFGIKVCVSEVHRGPAITRYEIQPAPGIKVSKIVRLADDIALSLAAPDVRIEAPIPGKAALGIEVPNKEIAPVYLRELLECVEFQDATSKLTVVLGKDIAGNPIVADLMKMPHILIAGATGSGKSVCLNTLISSILYKAAPYEVKFLLIDPKMVELTTYNGIPHLLAPVVTEPKKAASALRWVVSEMENRYELFASLGVRDIIRYNAQIHSNEKMQYLPLPYIVVVIDELADLMMVSPVEVEDSICRLAQMARAAGIHLVIATQRPSVDVITGIIKANIPSRIAFAVSSQIDSRTILDLNGAEKLLGRGDMLFLPVGAIKPIRVQGAFVTDNEVEEIVNYIIKQGEPSYISDFPEQVPETTPSDNDFGDQLFHDAAKLVMEMGHASVSLLQRRFRIGYSRAARIMDILEEKGIVGPYEGAKPRSVLMNPEQFIRFYGK